MASRNEKFELINKKNTHGKIIVIGYLGYLNEGGKFVARDIKVGQKPRHSDKLTEKQIEEKIKKNKKDGKFYGLDMHENVIKTFYLDAIAWILVNGEWYDFRHDISKLPEKIEDINNKPGEGMQPLDPESDAVKNIKAWLYDPKKNETGRPTDLGYKPKIVKEKKPSPISKRDPNYIDTSNVVLPPIDLSTPKIRKPISSLQISRRDK